MLGQPRPVWASLINALARSLTTYDTLVPSDVSVFKNGRHFAAWLGLVPKQHTTGGQIRLLGIRKRGDSYLRKLLIHGARETLCWAKTMTDRRSQWIRGLLEWRGWNRTTVAVANKNARIVWAVLSRGEVYHERAS
jgi:transposase